MSTNIIENMTSEDIVNAIGEVANQLNEIEKQYTPFVGMRFDEISTEDVETVRKLLVLTQQLTNVRAELRRIASCKFGIFVF